MSSENAKVICQGFTGGQRYIPQTKLSHTVRKWLVVFHPGKGGQTHLGLSVFNTVRENGRSDTAQQPTVIYVPAPFCKRCNP
ncbi:hypothetical protein O9993_13450 [Vibrio lentus]|nr:hypothetical protein [Vibrio lentus]